MVDRSADKGSRSKRGAHNLSWDDECARRLRTRTDKPFVGAGDEDSN